MSNSMINTSTVPITNNSNINSSSTGIKQLSTTTSPTSPRMQNSNNHSHNHNHNHNHSISSSNGGGNTSHYQPAPPSIFSSISPRNSITSFSNNRPNLINSSNNHRNYSICSATSGSSSQSSQSSPSQSSPNRYSFSEYSNEQIIDLMEREQDAIVLKLMKEIELLKHENKQLKIHQNNNGNNGIGNGNGNICGFNSSPGIMSAPLTPSIRRSSSLSSRSSSTSSSQTTTTTTTPNTTITNSTTTTISGAGGNNNNIGRNGSISMTSAPIFNYSFRGEQQKDASIYHNNCTNNGEVIKKKQRGEFNNHNTRRVSLKYDEIVDENRSLKRELKKLQNELDSIKQQKQ